MSDLRRIHDPVLSSLKMEGIRYFLSHTSLKSVSVLLGGSTVVGSTQKLKYSQFQSDSDLD
jgi:hypothetical protein